MKKIKICHFSSVHRRTDVRIFYKQCLSLVNNGFDVHFVVADGKGSEERNSVRIHDIGRIQNRFCRILISPLIMFHALLKLKCNIYQFHDPELLFTGLLIKLFTKSKVIYDAHECYADYMLQKDYLPRFLRPLFSRIVLLVERVVGKQLDYVIVTTANHAERLKSINTHIEIIHNYPLLSEWESYANFDYYDKGRDLCYIGNIIKERGITQLIDAIEKIDCKLHLAGSYEPLTYRDELIKQPGWSKVIDYGYVDRVKVAQVLSISIIGVVLFLPEPIHYTSISTKVFEYMAAGIPCLVPDFPIWKEIVERNNCGICVDTTNVSLIEERIRYLLDNKTKAIEMGINGRRLVKERYNWSNQEQLLINVYQTLSQ